MPVDVEPPELAQLIDFAERPRVADWSLRAALVRYAQPEPERVQQLLELVRRTDGALRSQSKLLEREGPEIWSSLAGDAGAPPDTQHLVDLLRTTQELDRIGDVLASWAVDRAGDRPNDETDAVIADVAPRLDELGVPREEPPPSRGRGRGV